MDTFNTKTRVLAVEELPGNKPDNGQEVLATLPVKPQERYKFIRTIGFGRSMMVTSCGREAVMR